MRQERNQFAKNGLIGIEHGHIYFFYQPRECYPCSVNDIRMLYCILHPRDARFHRLLMLDSKKLPTVKNEVSSTTGHVVRVNGKDEVLQFLMGGASDRISSIHQLSHVLTKQCGEGVYTIAIRESKTFLFFLLDTPKEEQGIAIQVGITSEAHFVLGIQNPWYKNTGRDDMFPAIPDSLKSSFDGDRVIYTMIPLLLNYERIQVIFFRTDLLFGQQMTEERLCSEGGPFSDVFDELELQREQHPVVSILNSKHFR